MIDKLQQKLHNEIPLTKIMGLELKSFDESKLVTTMPLNININDKGTAFGGSLSTMTIISSWSLCYLLIEELGYNTNSIVIINNTTSFRKPVIKNSIICNTLMPSKEELEILKEKLKTKKSSSLKIKSYIIEEDEKCVEFEGYFVIKV